MILKPLRIEVRLFTSLLGTVLALMLLALFLQSSLVSISRFRPDLQRRLELLEQVSSTGPLLVTLDTSLRGYLTTRDAKYLESYFAAKKLLEMRVAATLTDSHSGQGSVVLEQEWRNLARRWLYEYAEPCLNAGPSSAASWSMRQALGNDLMAKLNRVSNELINDLRAQIKGLENEETAEANYRQLWMWIAIATVTLVTFFTQHTVARSITGPLYRLTQAVKNLKQGDYNARCQIKTGDEIEILGLAFNEMAESIQQNRQELERTNLKLAEQQTELQNLNAKLEQKVAAQTEELNKTLSRAEADRNQLQTIINRMPDGLLLFNGTNSLYSANEAACKILGHADLHSLQQWVKDRQNAFSFRQLSQQEIPHSENPFARACKGEVFSNYSLYVKGADQKTRLVSFSGSPVLGANPERPVSALCICRDVTEELSLRRELEEKNVKLGEAARLKDEFLATLSHELRTPLTPIVSSAYLLRSEMLEEEDKIKFLEIIDRNAANLSQMIDEMLDLSALMNRKIRLNKEATEINNWITDSVETLRPAWEKKGLRCEISLWNEPLWLEVDRARMTQVLTNLITNAIKFTDKGGMIRVTLEQTAEKVLIAVQDTGVGLSRKEINEIFEMFHQGTSAFTRKSGGLGIGLSIARSLAQLHAGGIEARSEGPGKGSTFTIWLPRHSKKQHEPSPQSDTAPSGKAAALEPYLDGYKVLLIEDSLDTLDMLARILERRGAATITARSGKQGLDLALHEKPDIVISDIGLPGLDGLSLMRQLRRSLNGDKKMIALSVSGYGREQDTTAAREAGYDAHLVKPINIPALDSLLQELLKKNDS
jgi:signal transduction histidine kinase/ActR/RegA family two-component response regulator